HSSLLSFPSRRSSDLLPLGLVALARHAVEERHPARPPGVFVDQHLMRRGIRPHRQISRVHRGINEPGGPTSTAHEVLVDKNTGRDRKSTRLNSSHVAS